MHWCVTYMHWCVKASCGYVCGMYQCWFCGEQVHMYTTHTQTHIRTPTHTHTNTHTYTHTTHIRKHTYVHTASHTHTQTHMRRISFNHSSIGTHIHRHTWFSQSSIGTYIHRHTWFSHRSIGTSRSCCDHGTNEWVMGIAFVTSRNRLFFWFINLIIRKGTDCSFWYIKTVKEKE